MNCPCSLIQDLLPLYHDGACSEETGKIVEEHLSACARCKDFYNCLCEADEMVFDDAPDAALEMKKAASFRAVKKQLRIRQLGLVLLALGVFAILSLSSITFLKRSEQMISPDSVSVSMTDGSLLGRLQGNRANHLKIKPVSAVQDGQPKTLLFFCLSGSRWDDLLTGEDVFSEYVLCPADKNAAEIDQVFYYTGEYTGIESMSAEDLQTIIDSSVLLWSK